MCTNVQRAWSPRGETHLADASVGRKRVNVLGALNYVTTQLHFEVFEHTVKRQQVVPFLDNASIHHGIEPSMREQWLYEHRFVLFYLPPYSPELNLIELLWKPAKYHWRSFISWGKRPAND